MEKVKLDLKSSYLLRVLRGDYNPFTPNRVIITDEFIEFRRRNWYLISVDTKKFHFKSFSGLQVHKAFLGADLQIVGFGSAEIVARGFTKAKAEKIFLVASQGISSFSSTKNYYVKQEVPVINLPEELRMLKSLLDDGTLTPEEYDIQKRKILDR